MTADVRPIKAAAALPVAMPCPVHFRRVALKDAWRDLVMRSAPALHVPEMYFTFEFAAILMAKMRAGKPMTATESKELKKHLIALGLARDDDGGSEKPKKPNAHYFGKPAA